MRIDSLDMTDADRKAICEAVENSGAEHILITHGTDGMVETAAWLEDILDKKIILTGALQPAAFAENDAVFNIGCAIGAIQAISAGVYIAMNGQIFRADEVVKNRIENKFESIPR
jgi:L-asparaginase